MKSSRLLILLLMVPTTITLLAPAGRAEDWFFLVNDDQNVQHFLDRDSITRKGNLFEVKSFQVSSKIEEDGSVAVIAQFEISCQARKFRVKQQSTLLNDQSTRVSKDPTAWEPVKSGTVADLMLQKICNSQ